MCWVRAALLLTALPETTDMQRVFCDLFSYPFFFFFFVHSVSFVLCKISSRRFIAGNRHRGLAWCFSAEDETGCSHLKVPQFGRQEMRWSLLPGYCSVTLGCIPSPLPACPPRLRTQHLWGSPPELDLAVVVRTAPSTAKRIISTGWSSCLYKELIIPIATRYKSSTHQWGKETWS